MNFQRNNPQRLHAAIDAGSREIRVLVFEADGQGDAPVGRAKYVFSMPSGGGPDRVSVLVHDAIIRAIRDCGPLHSCVIGARSDLCPAALAEWRLRFDAPRAIAAEEEIAAAFQTLFEKRTADLSGALLAHPLKILVNGYGGIERFFEEKKKKQSVLAHEIAFQTAVLYGGERQGAESLSCIPRLFPGISFRIVPLFAAWLGAFAARDDSDMLFMDGAQKETNLLFARGEDAVAFFSFPARAYTEENKTFWVRDFLRALETLAESGPLPERVLVSGTDEFIGRYAPLLAVGEWMTFFSYACRPRVTLLSGDSAFSGDTLGGFLQTREDVSLAALTYSAAHGFFHSRMANGSWARIVNEYS